MINDQAVRVHLCQDCAAELGEVIAPFLHDAWNTRWPTRHPVVASDGSVWDPSEVRLVLEAVGLPAKSVGTLGPGDLARWHSLYTGDPALVAALRAAAEANPKAGELILERILADRGK